MRLPQGKSILRLVAQGFAVVAAPLIAAVIVAALQVERLAEQSRRAVLTTEIATQQSRAIAEHLTAMERSLGQFAVLGDPAIFRTYTERRDAFLLAAENLSTLRAGSTQRRNLRDLLAAEADLYASVTREPSRLEDVTHLTAAFAGLADQARAITAESRDLVEREANRMLNAADQLQRLLIILAATVIPGAIGLALLSIVLINRPLKALKGAIARLGHGDFNAPIAVHGPQDLSDLGNQLDWLRRRIVSLENDKVNFLRQASHELKTPLSSIREGAELLHDVVERNDANPRETREIVRIVRESSLRLQELIEQLLQFGKSAPGLDGESRPTVPVHLPEVIDQVVGKHELTLRAKDLRVDLQITDLTVQGDPVQLATIVDNIISNAIRYSPPTGAIRVSTRREQDQAILEVEDQGPGIDAEERQQVFEPFYQGRAAGTGQVKGTGLGLAIVKRFVEANGGTVEFLDSASGALLRASLPIGAHD